MAQINPVVAPALFPGGQKSFSDWLFSGLKQNPDGGWDLSPLAGAPNLPVTDPTQTNLPNVWNAWSPQGNSGIQGLVNYFTGNQGGIGQYDPLSQMLMSQGGTGGPGSMGMQSLLGSGMASPGAGGNLANFAQGNPVGSASYLLPFLTGQINSQRQAQAPNFQPGYRAPLVVPPGRR
jgi:hypothetical protein